MSYDIITIGDATIDTFCTLEAESELYHLDKKGEWLCLRYGSKIPVKAVNTVIGAGNAANVAMGTHRLGLKTALHTILGDDAKGQAIKERLARHAIGTEYISLERNTHTSSATVIDYRGDRTILVHHDEHQYKVLKFAETKWMYFSSICACADAFYPALARYVSERNIKLGFNPGSLQLRLGVAKLQPILSVSEVLFVDIQEGQRLVKKKTKDAKQLLRSLRRLGPRIIALTDGRNGSYCFVGEAMYQIGIVDLPVIERTGCGDAYASGFISALHYGLPPAEAMRWGSVNGAHEATALGSQTGILAKKEIVSFLNKHKDFQPRFIPT